MSALREIIARFGIQLDDKELKDGERGIEGFITKLKDFGETLATAFAVERVHSFIEGQIEAGAQLQKTAEKLGTETDELQAMQLAANEAGVSSESLATGLRFLNRHIAEAAKGGSGAAKTFKELGIHTKDAAGHTRTSTDIMADFADAIAKIDDPAKQTQIAMQLLGRGGVELLPILKQGGQAFRDSRIEMERLGGGMSKDFVKRAKEAEAANADLEFATMGLKSEIATALLPTFERLTIAMTAMVVEFREMVKGGEAVKIAFAGFAATAAILSPTMTAIAFAAAALYVAFHEIWGLLNGKNTVVGDALGPDKKAFVDELRDAVDELGGALDDLGGAFSGTDEGSSGFIEAIVIITKAVAGLLELLAELHRELKAIGFALASVVSGDWEGVKAALSGSGGKEKLANIANLQKERSDKQDQYLDWRRTQHLKQLYPEKSDEEIEAYKAEHQEVAQGQARGRVRRAFARGQFTGPVQSEPGENVTLPGGGFVRPGGGISRPRIVVPGHGGHAAVKNNIVHQNNAINVEVHGADVSDPNGIKSAVGSAVGPAIATSAQRGMSRANIANDKP